MRCDMQAYISFHWPGISVMVIVTSTWAHNCDTYTYQIEYVIDLNILLKHFNFICIPLARYVWEYFLFLLQITPIFVPISSIIRSIAR